MKKLSFLQQVKPILGSSILLYVLMMVLVSSISVSCNNDEGEKPDNTIEKPFDPSNPEDAAMAEWLVGTWGYSTSNGSVHLDNMLGFKEDGTFTKILSTLVYAGRQATVYTGKYRISGNKLTLYNQLKSTGSATLTHFDEIWYIEMDSYTQKDVPWEDEEVEINKMDEDILQFVFDDDITTEYIRGQ